MISLAKRRGAELEFLPAALEVVETPPNPAARWLAWTLIAFFAVALGWSWLGHVDVIAVADGRLINAGKSKLVQPAETGIVRAIHVRDGSVVRAGDLLVELDPTNAQAETTRLTQELFTARINAARLAALIDAPDTARALAAFVPPAGADAALVEGQRRLLRSEVEEHRARLTQLAAELARKQAERASVHATLKRLDDAIPLLSCMDGP